MNEFLCVIDWPKVSSVIKDLVVSIAAICTAFVAWKGIEKWRSEEVGKADYDLARRLGKAVYKLRDSLRSARSYMVLAAEYPADYQPGDGNPRNRAEAWQHVFNGRWAPVRDAASELRLVCQEVEALWGEAERKRLDKLLQAAHTLYVAMGAYVRNEAASGAHFHANKEFGDRMSSQIFDTGETLDEDGASTKPNDLTRQIDDAVSEIMASTRPRMPQHKRP